MLRIYSVLAALFILTAATAQKSTYERTPGYYTFGINGGLSYQQSDDIPTTLEGYGLGLTLAKNLYYQPGAPFAFDIRGRALYAQTKGLGFERSYGIADNDALNGTYGLDYTKDGNGTSFVFQNNKTDQFELGLEGVVSFNKLRENTNVNLSVFGGIGLDWYNVKTDQADRNGNYGTQYLGIDTLGSVSYRKNELKNAILDGVYETNAHGFESGFGKIGLMPNLGVELGYQFTPRFSMGVGHKVTFTKTDLFDGQQWKNNGNLSPEDDIHHYTNLHMRWIIDDKSKELKEPFVEITNPGVSPHTTRTPFFNILATIKHVDSPMDVEFIVNGYNESFNFRKKSFKGNIRLRPGNNEIIVRARNAAGSASDQVNIFLQEEIITPPVDNYTYAPEVDITNPPYTDFRTDIGNFDLRAEVRNVSSYRDVELTINGRNFTNFDLRNGIVSALVDLREGRNTIRVSAQNSDGYDMDETTIIFERTIISQPPVVRITRPSVSPYETTSRKVKVEARVDHIDNKRDIRYTVNGYESYDFDFSNGTLYADLNINGYKTVVNIVATNPDGKDSDSVTILWEEEDVPVLEKPVVTITSTSQPTIDPFDPTNCKTRVVATILNVEDRDDIDVYVNGQQFSNYDFNSTTQVLNAVVQLIPGTNNIRIVATNAAGRDEDTARTEGCATIQEEEATPPSVTITVPTRDNQTVSESIATIKAEILEIEDKRDITFRLNGSTTSNFTWEAYRNSLTAKVNLRNGKNTIEIEAKNEDGRASDVVTITYEQPRPVRLPKVTITTPEHNSTSKKEIVKVRAVINNISRKDELTLLVNGRSTSNFSYQRGTLEANVSLKEGKNVIIVKAQNRDGKADDQVNVSYEKPAPVLPPKVTITKPKNNLTSEKATISVRAAIDNISRKDELTVLVNGRSTSNFSYQRGTLEANVSLKQGKNTIVVKAQNRDGKDDDQVSVTYRPKVQTPKPDVRFTNPGKSSASVRTDRFTVKAKIQHVKDKKDITFKMNGKSLSNFKYSAKSGELSITVRLKTGKNNFSIEAQNESGKDDAQAVVNYQHMISKKNPPKISNLNASTPTIDPFNPDKGRSRITATIEHVSKKNQITVKVNGSKVSSFSYNTSTKKLDVVVELTKGRNSVEVSATSNDGSDKATKTINFGNGGRSDGKDTKSGGSSSNGGSRSRKG